MSMLIDVILKAGLENAKEERDGRWYIAKGYPYWTFHLQWLRIKDAIRVLLGKSQAYHYKSDE